jgi:AcrR family transcriptional regulator
MTASVQKKDFEGATAACVRREEILHVATRVFAQQGYSEAVTQTVADELGVGKGTLYRYFPSKRELFLAAVDRAMGQLHEHVDRCTRDVPDGLERVRMGVRAYLAFFREHPEFVEMLVQERAQFKDRDRPTYFEHRARHVERWRDLYRRLIGEGRVRDIPPDRISDVVAAVLYGAMFLNDAGGRSGAFTIDADAILDLLFYGLLTSGERSRCGE